MDYMTMLYHWRFASFEDPMFKGDAGKYFTEVMKKKRIEVGDEAHTAASKSIGWEK